MPCLFGFLQWHSRERKRLFSLCLDSFGNPSWYGILAAAPFRVPSAEQRAFKTSRPSAVQVRLRVTGRRKHARGALEVVQYSGIRTRGPQNERREARRASALIYAPGPVSAVAAPGSLRPLLHVKRQWHPPPLAPSRRFCIARRFPTRAQS